MTRLTYRLTRWSLRRSLLGCTLVLHAVWLTLGGTPLAAAHENELPSMPCHEAMMMGDMAMPDMAMPEHQTAPAPLKPTPTRMPCCTQNCACAAGLCAVAAAALHITPLLAPYRLPTAALQVPPSRELTPELRPPILH